MSLDPEAPIAVVGGAGLLGRSVIEQLDRRGVRPDRLRLSDTPEEAGRVQEVSGEASVVAEIDADRLALACEVFLCVGAERAESLLAGPRARGSIWVDLSGAASRRPRVPLVNLQADPHALPRRPSGLVAAPGPEAQFLSSLLAPLASRGWARGVRAVLLVPASREGEAGLDELYRQSVGLLNFGDVPREVFGAQLAFNVLPAAPALSERAARETSRVLKLSPRRVSAIALRTPVFHGHAAAVHLDPGPGVKAHDVAEVLRATADVAVAGRPEEATSVALAGRTEIVAAEPMDDGTGKSLWLWAACDDLTGGAARNAVRIAAACRDG